MTPIERSGIPIQREFSPHIESTIQHQLRSFLATRQGILENNSLRNATSIETDMKFLEGFLSGFLTERISRSEELSSPEIKLSVEKAIHLMGSKPGAIYCMDGRLPITVIFGLPMPAVKGVRLPGGDTPGFKHNEETGQLVIEEDSLLDRLMRINGDVESSTTKFEVMISHTGCAARAGLEQLAGRKLEDNGLFDDVDEKNEQGKVLEREFGLRPIGFVYNPETGYGYMGLAQDNVIQTIKDKEGVFTTEVIDRLVDEGIVISTKKIAEKYREEFLRNSFEVDWQGNYKDTAMFTWLGMERMSTTVLPEIIEDLSALYPDREPDEIQMRATLILANAFQGWLHNPTGEKHPFDEHNESCVVIDYKTKGPFKNYPAFIVTPVEGSIPEYVLLAQSLVRNNRMPNNGREHGTVVDAKGIYPSIESFAQAPVPIIYKAEIGIHSSQTEVWGLIRSLDWSEIARTWQNANLKSWLNNQIGDQLSHREFEAVLSVLETMQANLTELKQDSKVQFLLERGSLTILPLLVSQDRKPQSIAHMVA